MTLYSGGGFRPEYKLNPVERAAWEQTSAKVTHSKESHERKAPWGRVTVIDAYVTTVKGTINGMFFVAVKKCGEYERFGEVTVTINGKPVDPDSALIIWDKWAAPHVQKAHEDENAAQVQSEKARNEKKERSQELENERGKRQAEKIRGTWLMPD